MALVPTLQRLCLGALHRPVHAQLAEAADCPLIDCVQALPPEQLGHVIMAMLLSSEDYGSLRLGCRQLSNVVLHLTWVTLSLESGAEIEEDDDDDLESGAESEDDDDDDDDDDAGRENDEHRAQRTARWLAALQAEERLEQRDQQLTAHLERTPTSTGLELRGWSTDTDLVHALQTCGTDTRGRLQRLTLMGWGALSTTCGRAIGVACPALTHLRLAPLPWEGAEGLAPNEAAAILQLTGPLFLPLPSATLTKVRIERGVAVSPSAMASLSHLTNLQHLTLHAGGNTVGNLPHLTSLSRLTHLEVHAVRAAGSAASGVGLLDLLCQCGSTVLDTLLLNDTPEGAPDPNNVPAPALVPPPVNGAAATAAIEAGFWLGKLLHLRRLHLSATFVLNSAVFSGVQRLTQLTQLRLGGVHLTVSVASDHLPRLRRLCVTPQPPASTLAVLLPLVPLPSLEAFGDPFAVLGIFHGGAAGEAAAQAVALQRVASHLAAAPHLQLRRGLLVLQGAGLNSPHLTLNQAVAGLQPLAARVGHLGLRFLRLGGVDWQGVHGDLPALRHLTLQQCTVLSTDLENAMRRMTGLRSLHLCCVRCEADTRGWTRIALRRTCPLQLKVEPPLPLQWLFACRYAAMVVYRRQHILWL